MTLIYSNTKIEGLEGVYRNPLFFNGVEKAELVYTDNKKIAEAYKKNGVEVKSIKRKGNGKGDAK